MALPIIAAGIAARAVAKKLATRAVAGIIGAGAKQVAPVYREMGTGSVTKIPKVTKFQQNTVNKMNTNILNERKSGGFAKNSAVQMQGFNNNLVSKKPTVKIKSGK